MKNIYIDEYLLTNPYLKGFKNVNENCTSGCFMICSESYYICKYGFIKEISFSSFK